MNVISKTIEKVLQLSRVSQECLVTNVAIRTSIRKQHFSYHENWCADVLAVLLEPPRGRAHHPQNLEFSHSSGMFGDKKPTNASTKTLVHKSRIPVRIRQKLSQATWITSALEVMGLNA